MILFGVVTAICAGLAYWPTNAVAAGKVQVDLVRFDTINRPGDGKQIKIIRCKIINATGQPLRRIEAEVSYRDASGSVVSGHYSCYDSASPLLPNDSVDRFFEIGIAPMEATSPTIKPQIASK